MQIAGVILAGGQGRRMGGADKALVSLCGQPLLTHVMARLAPQVAALAVSANGDAARLARFGLPILPDAVSMGPLSGILAGLHWAKAQGCDAIVSVPVDTPFLPGDLVARLSRDAGTAPAMAESGGRVHPAAALWPVGLVVALTAFLASGAKARVLDFANAQGAVRVAFGDPAAFDNLNNPDDLALAAARLNRGA